MKIDAKSHFTFLSENLKKLASTTVPLWHPLGFVSCIIKQTEEFTLRVHFWPKGERRVKNPDWPIHTHSYFLSSFVLKGTVRDIQYKSIEGGENVVYSVRYFEGGSEITQSSSRVGVVQLVDKLRHEGDSYVVDLNVFHQSVIPSQESAVTLVALSNFTNSPPLVLGSSAEERYPYDRTPYDKGFFWESVSSAVSETLNKRVS